MSSEQQPSFRPPPEISASAAWSRMEAQQKHYSSEASVHQTRYRNIKLALILVSASIPILAFLPWLEAARYIVAGSGVLIAVLEGILLLNRYGEHGITYRRTSEGLKRERALLLAEAGEYAGKDLKERLRLLAERTEALLDEENKLWQQQQAKALEELAKTQEWAQKQMSAQLAGATAGGSNVSVRIGLGRNGDTGGGRAARTPIGTPTPSAPADQPTGRGRGAESPQVPPPASGGQSVRDASSVRDSPAFEIPSGVSIVHGDRNELSPPAKVNEGRQSDEPAREDSSTRSPESVQFRAYTPRELNPGESAIVDIWACLPSQVAAVAELASSTEQSRLAGLKIGARLERETELQVRVESEVLTVDPPMQALTWSGDIANVSFSVSSPGDGRAPNYPATAKFLVSGMAIGEIRFVIPRAKADSASASGRTPWDAETYRKAFASYSSDDRETVLTTVRGMKKVAPDLDVFVDVIDLRSGQDWRERLKQEIEQRERLFLFWSDSASQSKYVDFEWRLALSVHGIKSIDPVPLVAPSEARPPDELRSLHFNDAYLAFIAEARRRKAVNNPPDPAG